MSKEENKKQSKPQEKDFANMQEVPEEKRLEWVYENTKRIIYYINTLEHWRHAKFKSLDEIKKESEEAKNGKADEQRANAENKPADTDSSNPS